VLRHDLIEPLADLDDLLGLDADVGGLALEPPRGWWIMIREFGSA